MAATHSGVSARNSAAMADPVKPKPFWNELAAMPEVVLTSPGMALAAALAPTGAARPVLVIPGFTGGDVSTLPLRTFLRALGHRPTGWGLGVNVGVADHIAVGLDRLLRELAHRHGTTIDIVGWSAGGILGRLLAQNRGDLVGQVITLGSPIRLRSTDHNLGLLASVVGWFYVPTAPRIDVDRVPVPSTTIWTPRDGVVAGELCKQTIRNGAEAIEVRGTHSGLGTNPAVAYAVADRLAQTGPWQPFDPPRRVRWWYGSIENSDNTDDDSETSEHECTS